MNITGGKFNGRKITTVKSNEVRPTSSKVRSSIFNMLNSMDFNLQEALFLDLFAGSAIMGIEALSRGASKSVFIEKNIATYKLIQKNLNKFDANFETFNMDALKFLNSTQDKYDIIYADPPYMSGLYDSIIDVVLGKKLLTPQGILILETPLEYKLPENISPIREKSYGDTKIYFVSSDNQ